MRRQRFSLAIQPMCTADSAVKRSISLMTQHQKRRPHRIAATGAVRRAAVERSLKMFPVDYPMSTSMYVWCCLSLTYKIVYCIYEVSIVSTIYHVCMVTKHAIS